MGTKGYARFTGDGVFGKPVGKRWKVLGLLAVASLAALLVATTSHAAETANLHITGVTIVGPPNGQTAAAPASRVDYSVSGTTSNGATWARTAYRIDGGSWTCVDSGSGGTRTIPGSGEITLPGLPGNHTIEFRMHQSNSCSESSPYSAVYTINPALAPRTSNPNLAEACGSLNVVLILDESGSITNTASYVTNVRNAAKAFVNGLKGTGANLAVVEFDETATKPLGPTYIPISDPVPASWTNYIDNQYGSNSFWSSGTYTNWQDALSKTAEIDATANADLVVFITDGDPTAYGVSPAAVTTGQPDGYFTGLKPAFDLANSLKAGGSHMLAVGVGNAVGADSDAPNKKLRLKGVSDDEELLPDASNIKTADVAFVTNFADLETALSNLATALCRSSVTILKQVDEADGQGYKPVSGSAAGWQFTPLVTVSTGSFSWELGGPGPASTLAPGGVTFQWKPSNIAATSDATFTETVKPGYTMTGVTCTPGVNLSQPTNSSFFIDNLPFKGSTTCTVKNQRNAGTIQLKKQFIGGPASQRADLFIKQNGSTITGGFADDVASGGGTAVLTVPTGTYDISELAGANTDFAFYSKTWDCTKNGLAFIPSTAGSSGSAAVGPAENIVCTFRNTFNKFPSSSVTTPAKASLVLGASNSDGIVVTGNATGGSPSGTVDFFVCSPAQLTGGVCSSGGTKVGATKALVAGGGNTASVSSDAFTPSVPGTWCFRGVYGGDANYLGSSDSALTECFTVTHPGIHIVKSPANQQVRVGGTASFTLTATNTGDVPLSNVAVSDVQCTSGPTFTGGDTNGNSILETSETWTYSCSISPVGTNDFTNTATVTGKPPVGPDVTDDDTANVDVIHPLIHIVKSPATQNVPVGQAASFTLTVTNPGDVPLSNVAVSDVQCTSGPTFTGGDTNGNSILETSETWTYTCSIANVQSDFTNTAGVTGKPPVGANVTDDDSASVHVLKGTITLIKDFEAAPQGATTTIQIKQGGTVKREKSVSDGGSVGGPVDGIFPPASYTVGETTGAGNVDLALYDQSVVCVNGQAPVANNPTGSSVTFDLQDGANVVCTIKNALRPVLTVKKLVVGDSETKFDLFVKDGQQFNVNVLDNAGNGATDTRTYSPGAYTVSETLSDGSTPVDPSVWDVTYGDNCPDHGAVSLAYGDVKACTITNSKRPVVKVAKQVEPADDGGAFNLAIEDKIGKTIFTNAGNGFGDNQDTGFKSVAAGPVTVSEDDHGDTMVSSYFNDVTCDSDKGSNTGAPHTNRDITFAANYGDVVTCTFTNTHKPLSIKVGKTPSPTQVNEPGGSVVYTVDVENTSEVDKVKLDVSSFVDQVNKNANPTGPGNTSPDISSIDCAPGVAGNGLPVVLTKFGTGATSKVKCTFTLPVGGNAGDKINDRITVTGKEDKLVAPRSVVDYDEATVEIVNVDPAIEVQKTVKSTGDFADEASLPEPGGVFTFQVVVKNTSAASSDPLDITALTDSIYGDLTTVHDKILSTTCAVPQNDLPKGGTYTCQFTASFAGNPGASETDTVTATGKDDEGNEKNDTDSATVHITNVPSSIAVTKAASPTTVAEPGGPVKFTVTVLNTSATDAVTLDVASFVDKVGDGAAAEIGDIDCNGAADGNGFPMAPLAVSSPAVTCTFTKNVTGQPGDVIHDDVTVTGTDDDGGKPADTAGADVTVTDVPTKLSVVKDANPETVQEGTRAITFTITITNVLSFTQGEKVVTAVDDITVFSLQDNKLGDLDAAGDVTCKVGGVTKSWPITIGPGQSIVCTLTRNVTGTPSTPHSNTATAKGYDSDHPNGCAESSVEPFCKTASDSATVTFTATPPPPYVPHSDVTVTKTATSAVQLPQGGGTAPITYNIAAKNNGPDAAANVKVSDAAPAGVTFVSATTGKGTCTTTAQAVDCTIPSLAVGESVPITISATVNATGTKTNVVVISNTTPPDTNPNNNTASASTVVTAPVTPPKPPVVTPDVCELLTVTPKVLKGNGKAQKVSVKVTKGKKPVAGAKVKITGPGINKTVKTGKNGKVTVTLKPGKPGIIRVAILDAKTCNTQRIGVVGVYEPPVTG